MIIVSPSPPGRQVTVATRTDTMDGISLGDPSAGSVRGPKPSRAPRVWRLEMFLGAPLLGLSLSDRFVLLTRLAECALAFPKASTRASRVRVGLLRRAPTSSHDPATSRQERIPATPRISNGVWSLASARSEPVSVATSTYMVAARNATVATANHHIPARFGESGFMCMLLLSFAFSSALYRLCNLPLHSLCNQDTIS